MVMKTRKVLNGTEENAEWELMGALHQRDGSYGGDWIGCR
jgi:hypothetical protein